MNERQICLAPDHCDTEDKAIETLHSYQEEYQINLDRLINRDWQLYLNDISTNDLKKAIVFTLEVCPKHSCKKELLATKVLKFINVHARKKKRKEFKKKVYRVLNALIKQEIIKQYTSTNTRVKLTKEYQVKFYGMLKAHDKKETIKGLSGDTKKSKVDIADNNKIEPDIQKLLNKTNLPDLPDIERDSEDEEIKIPYEQHNEQEILNASEEKSDGDFDIDSFMNDPDKALPLVKPNIKSSHLNLNPINEIKAILSQRECTSVNNLSPFKLSIQVADETRFQITAELFQAMKRMIVKAHLECLSDFCTNDVLELLADQFFIGTFYLDKEKGGDPVYAIRLSIDLNKHSGNEIVDVIEQIALEAYKILEIAGKK